MVYPGKEKRELRASDYVELAARMRVTGRYSGAADDLRLADEMLAQARTKQLPSTRTEIGAGGELIDREKVGSYLVDTVAHPDYVTAEASSDRLALASQAGSLSLALDAADTIQAQDSLEKMLIHQITALHSGMMRATAQMNKELDAAGGTAIDAAGDKRDLTVGEREAANVRACRLAGAISRMSATCQQRLAHASAQANGRKPARHGEAHSSTSERHRRQASGGRRRQGNEQDQGTAGERPPGGWSRMSDEPLPREREAREGEPIERVRARLEALVRANAAPRCGARSKRTGKPCRAAAMPNGRCKVHGGKSTGPRTPEGLERSRR